MISSSMAGRPSLLVHTSAQQLASWPSTGSPRDPLTLHCTVCVAYGHYSKSYDKF